MSFLIFILILVALIVVHEFGHFSVAKLFGIKVEEFGIGFPPRLLSIKMGETEYSINLLFFGGFVKIFGENAHEHVNEPRSFVGKPRIIQAAVVVAGIAMNLLFAWLVLSVGYMVGLPTSSGESTVQPLQNVQTTIVGLIPNSPAQKAGLLAEDVIESVKTATAALPAHAPSADAQKFIASHQDETLSVVVMRDGAQKSFDLQAEAGLVPGHKAIGVELDDVGLLKLPPHLALVEGATLTYHMTISTAEGLASFFSGLFRGTASFGDVSGPIGIVGVGAHAVRQGFTAAIFLTALISINLAIINVIPIPGLDGGRLLMIAVEGLRRKALSPKLTIVLTIAGFAFLIGLMLIVSYHDIARLVG